MRVEIYGHTQRKKFIFTDSYYVEILFYLK
jgi:hypothetical protein